MTIDFPACNHLAFGDHRFNHAYIPKIITIAWFRVVTYSEIENLNKFKKTFHCQMYVPFPHHYVEVVLPLLAEIWLD